MLLSIDKKKRLFIYLFVFLLLSTFNNITLNNYKYFKFDINQIIVSGLNEDENLKILESLNNINLQNIFFIKKNEITDILEKNNLISTFTVKKIYPSLIKIDIKKTDYLAVTNLKNNFYYVGSNEKFIKFDSTINDLPFIFGAFKIDKFIEFKKIIDNSKFDYKEIKEFYSFPSGRWDIKDKEGILLKLPKDDLKNLLNLAYIFINTQDMKKNKILDLRTNQSLILTNE